MRIVDRGVLNPPVPHGNRSVSVCPTITTLRDGSLLATYVIGASKDDDSQTVELRRSNDGGRTWGDPSSPVFDDASRQARLAGRGIYHTA